MPPRLKDIFGQQLKSAKDSEHGAEWLVARLGRQHRDFQENEELKSASAAREAMDGQMAADQAAQMLVNSCQDKRSKRMWLDYE
jgi:hypothetical protein